MPQAIPAAASAFAQWAVSTFGTTLTAAQAAAGTAGFVNTAIYVTAYTAAYAGLTAAVTLGVSAIAQAGLPSPEGQKITRKQTRPLRCYPVGGPSRMSGAYMLRESNGNKLGVVIAICDGRLAEITRHYLNDTQVTVAGGFVQGMAGERYGSGDLIRLETRLGVPSEVPYAFLEPDFGAYWETTGTYSARGDGIASLGFLAQHRSRESFARHFPDGEPIPSVVGTPVCYDWRDPAQTRADPSTWQTCWNPVVWLVHVEWHRHGRNWTRTIAPVLDDLAVEADYCDDLVTRDGVTEARYRCAGNVFSNTSPQALREGLLATMDGWLATNGKGHLVVKAGRYEEPTWTLTEDHITGYSWRSFQVSEETTNALVISYVSADHDYSEVEAGSWRDEEDITARGVERSDPLQLPMCPSQTQAMALGVRKGKRLNPRRHGQVRADIDGLNGLGCRYIRVQNPELSSMADVVLEVTKAEIDFASAGVVFDVILADPTIDDEDVTVITAEAIARPAAAPGYQQPAVVPINRDADYPISASVGALDVESFSIVLPDGSSYVVPAATVAVADSARNGLFWRQDVGFEVEAWPATAHMSTGSWVFLGWQDSPDSSGTFPDRPPPPEGWGGNYQLEAQP